MTNTLFRRNPLNKVRTISSNDAKQHWGAMMKAASEGEAVIVESHGKPKAVVISPEEFDTLQVVREKQRREEAMRLLQEIEDSYDGRNDDLTEEQIEEIAVREGREINRAVAERLRIRSHENR